MSGRSKGRILFVDDEAEILENLQELFQAQGYTADTVSNGLAALTHLSQAPYDLVVTDVRMPDMSGIELLRQIKKRYPHVEVILMTGYASTETAIEAIRLGVYDYIEKPFDALELSKVIVNGLEHISLKRRNASLVKALQAQQQNLEQKVAAQTAAALEQERKLARVDMLRQVLATLAHHINNASCAIFTCAETCQSSKQNRSEDIAQLIDISLRQGQKITAVIDSLQEVVQQMDIKSVPYIEGWDQMMIDIESKIEQRMDHVTVPERT